MTFFSLFIHICILSIFLDNHLNVFCYLVAVVERKGNSQQKVSNILPPSGEKITGNKISRYLLENIQFLITRVFPRTFTGFLLEIYFWLFSAGLSRGAVILLVLYRKFVTGIFSGIFTAK